MKKEKIAIIGLGYVGLPLARLFATKFPVIGYDINVKRVNEINDLIDTTLELSTEMLGAVVLKKTPTSKGLFCTAKKEKIKNCSYYIITVPTPIDKNKKPNLKALIRASREVGSVLKKDDIVIYESTVYPGATEEDCIPVLEKESNLIFNKDFLWDILQKE